MAGTPGLEQALGDDARSVAAMSRRDRGVRRPAPRPYGRIVAPPRPPAPRNLFAALGTSLREQLERASPQARALLPIRFFFGLTFLYAGIDKLADPSFLDPTATGGIVSQLHAFTRISPIGPLVGILEPFAVLVGLLVAIGEIGIGIGALTGLAFRLAAAGGAILSLTFWLTASWTTHPFYYGADLPYAFGWIALAIAGHGDLLVPTLVAELGGDEDNLPILRADGSISGRRAVLQAGVLASVAMIVGAASLPLRLFRGDDTGAIADGGNPSDGGTGDGSGNGSGDGSGDGSGNGSSHPTDPSPEEPSEDPSDDPTADPTSTPFKATGLTVASIATVDRKGAVRIRIPANAPSPLPAGDPGIVAKLADGSYVCYDAVCTHEGCRVGWDPQDQVLLCPCHGAAFDPTDNGAVLGGPTNTPLQKLPIVIDHEKGTITLQA